MHPWPYLSTLLAIAISATAFYHTFECVRKISEAKQHCFANAYTIAAILVFIVHVPLA